MAIILIEEKDLQTMIRNEIQQALKLVLDKLELLDRDILISADEAIRVSKLSRTAIYEYLHSGYLINYGDSKKPLFSYKECETARFRKKNKQPLKPNN